MSQFIDTMAHDPAQDPKQYEKYLHGSAIPADPQNMKQYETYGKT